MSRCPGRLCRNLARPRTCQDGQNTCQLSALVWWEKSDSRLQLRCRPMRISAGSDSLPAEFLRGRGGGKQARIVSWQLTNSRSRLQHCLNPPTWRRRLSASDYTWKHGMSTHDALWNKLARPREPTGSLTEAIYSPHTQTHRWSSVLSVRLATR